MRSNPMRESCDNAPSSLEVWGDISPRGKEEAPKWPESITVTCQPSSANARAVLAPETPAPITQATLGDGELGAWRRNIALHRVCTIAKEVFFHLAFEVFAGALVG